MPNDRETRNPMVETRKKAEDRSQNQGREEIAKPQNRRKKAQKAQENRRVPSFLRFL
jgi:hypothetical protein